MGAVTTIPVHSPALVPLAEAIAPYRGVTLRVARKWVREGRLPAVVVRHTYLVRPADVAEMLTPRLLGAAPPRPEHESPGARERRLLEAAGVAAAAK